jgi:hypothetical protein
MKKKTQTVGKKRGIIFRIIILPSSQPHRTHPFSMGIGTRRRVHPFGSVTVPRTTAVSQEKNQAAGQRAKAQTGGFTLHMSERAWSVSVSGTNS